MQKKIYKISNWRIRRLVIFLSVLLGMTFVYSLSLIDSLMTLFWFAWIFIPALVVTIGVLYILRMQFNRTYILDFENLIVVFNKKDHSVPWPAVKIKTTCQKNVFLTQIEGHQTLGFTSTGYDDFFNLLGDILDRIPDSQYDLSSLALVEVNKKAKEALSGADGPDHDEVLKKGYASFLRGSMFFHGIFRTAYRNGSQEAAEALVLIEAGSSRWPLVVSEYQNNVRQTDDPLVRFCYAYGLFVIRKNDLAKQELQEMLDQGQTLNGRVNQLFGMLS
jgi:hypothetical protein